MSSISYFLLHSGNQPPISPRCEHWPLCGERACCRHDGWSFESAIAGTMVQPAGWTAEEGRGTGAHRTRSGARRPCLHRLATAGAAAQPQRCDIVAVITATSSHRCGRRADRQGCGWVRGRKLGVSRSRITELLKKHGTLPAPETLSGDTGEAARTGPAAEGTASGGHDTGSADRAGARPPASRAARTPTPGRKPAEPPTPMGRPGPKRGPGPSATGKVRAGRWRGGSRPGPSRAGTRARCWRTPSPTGSAPGAC